MNFDHEIRIALTWHSQYGQKHSFIKKCKHIPQIANNLQPEELDKLCSMFHDLQLANIFSLVGLTHLCLSYVKLSGWGQGLGIWFLMVANFTSLDMKRATFSASQQHTECTDWLEHAHYKPRRP